MKNVHFIGVSGIGVSAVAKLTIQKGAEVSGSALEENEQTKELVRLGMKYYLGHRSGQIGKPDIVVCSAAVPPENQEVLEAQKKQIPVYLYPEYLGMLMKQKQGIAVAGTHGKSTTTAIIGTILKKAGLDPTIVCGGVMNDFSSNAVSGEGDYFLAEACEYNRSFLSLVKCYSVITNIEPDHLDTYEDIHEIKSAFRSFIETTDARGFAVVNGDDAEVLDTIKDCSFENIHTVGKRRDNKYRITEVESERGLYSFSIECSEWEKSMRITLQVPGSFNCINFSISAVLCLELGIEKKIIAKAIKGFGGMSRRLEMVGTIGTDPVYSDYAHHPTEIHAAVDTIKEMYPSRRVVAVFQPHQYSRTFLLFNEFVKVLETVDRLILTEIYRQRDSESFVSAVSSAALYDELQMKMNDRVVYVEKKDDIIEYLKKERQEESVILFMGAGDIDDVARRYVGD